MKIKQRFCFVKDNDSHLYLIPVELKTEFFKMKEEAYSTEEFDLFEEKFSSYRKGTSLSSFSFEDPVEE